MGRGASAHSAPEAPPTSGESREPPGERWTRRPATTLEWVALAAGIAPLIVAIGWALVVEVVPLGDSGQLVVRSRDVFTHHHPLLGAWSSSSRSLGQNVNNLGSLYITLLSPFSRVDPYRGGAVGVGALNLAAIIGVWVVARRLFGPLGVAAAMGATLAIEASMGSVSMLDARQQLALVLPFWCLLWLVVAIWAGWTSALPALVFVASVILQTHFTYVSQTAMLLLAAGIAFVGHARHRWGHRAVRMPALVAGGVLAACWAQPLWDLVFGSGNLVHVLGRGGESSGAPGLTTGVELAARAGLKPPFWASGSMGRREDAFLVGGGFSTSLSSWVAVLLWSAGTVLAYVAARRTGRRHRTALAGVAAVALAGGLLAAARIPAGSFALFAAQNYFWMWPIGLLVALALGDAALGVVRSRVTVASSPATLVALVPVILLAVISVRPASSLDTTRNEAFRQRPIARELVAELGASLDRLQVRGPVIIDDSRDQLLLGYRYIYLAELQRRGIEFTFDGGKDDADLRRFGLARCETGSARVRIYLQSGPPIDEPRPGETLLARAGPPDDVQADAERLRARFGDALREDRVVVPADVVAEQPEQVVDALDRVLETDGEPASGLAPLVRQAGWLGRLEVVDDLREDLDRWLAVEKRVDRERVSVSLAPIPPAPEPAGGCER